MQLLAYIVFGITTLLFLGLALFTVAEPGRGSESSIGYGWGAIILSLGFALSSLILLLIVRSRGGFDWVGHKAATRTALLVLFWLAMSITTFFGAILKLESFKENTSPPFLQALAVSQPQLWVPMLWLMVSLLSLNPGWVSTLSLGWFKLPFWLGFSISTLFTAGLVVVYIHDSIQRTTGQVATRNDDEKRWHQQRLDQVAAHKADDSIFGLLGFTNQYQADDVRQAALAKIKSHPDWEAQLLDLLANPSSYQYVYSFLGSNPVAHPDAFIEPLNRSIGFLAEDIVADIKGRESSLQHWTFDSYTIEPLLRALDTQFGRQIELFYPNVLHVQQALKTPLPEVAQGVRFDVSPEVDDWVKAHKNKR
ncbi:hypothetical protein GJR95_31870 [Spirosoma endbachense]|uniref:Uncharacterized protein n=2 Tax=Spirosoma endbachense TaxID=2666025 RepID=A0A6P1W5M1_9BACT|nr:hypothetical protein GJR95_31870 [Spirosoma endbachense]